MKIDSPRLVALVAAIAVTLVVVFVYLFPLSTERAGRFISLLEVIVSWPVAIVIVALIFRAEVRQIIGGLSRRP